MLHDDNDTGVTRVVSKGFMGIDFPEDIETSCGSCDILVIGLGEFFSPDVSKLLKSNSVAFRILTTMDDGILRARAKSLDWVYRDYAVTVQKDYDKFIKSYASAAVTVRMYSKYPFGLYLRVGNYAWFTPLWSVWYPGDAGTAIHQRTIEVRSESYLGEMLDINFNHLWDSGRETSK